MSAAEIVTTVSAAVAAGAALAAIWRANVGIGDARKVHRAQLASLRIAQLNEIADLVRDVISACLAVERESQTASIGALSPIPAIGLRLQVGIAAYRALGGREVVEGLKIFADQAHNAIREPPANVRGWAQAVLPGLVKYIDNESTALGNPHE